MGAALLLSGSSLIGQTTLCPNDSLTLNLAGATGSIQWEISTNGTTWSPVAGQTSATLVTKPAIASWYRAMVVDGTCDPVYSDTTMVNYSDLQANGGPDVVFCGGGGTIGAAATGGAGGYSYLWSPATGLSSTTVATPTANPAVSTTYTVEVTDANGCVSIDTVEVTISSGGSTGSQMFLANGSVQTFTVPGCVTSITIAAYGAQGGIVTQSGGSGGGLGAVMIGTFAVTPGQVLSVIAGQRGNPETYTSGGGGGSGVSDGTTPWIVAGGGGGSDFQDMSYPLSNAPITTAGNPGNQSGGAGGVSGGDGGDYIYSGNNFSRGGRGWLAGATGTFGQNGSSPNTSTTQGVFGLGGGGGSVGTGWCNCGAGGGGYSGGGAGNINTSGGGGGSYNAGTNQNNTAGANAGDGRVVISW